MTIILTMMKMIMLKMIMIMMSIMMSSDAPGSSGAGTQRAKDDGGEGLRRPEHQEHEDYKYLLFIIYHL